MKTGYTHISVLLDRSGSMATIKDDTEGGYATFLESQQPHLGDATVELRQFDTHYEQVHGPVPVREASPLVLEPRGGTALLDAMGRSIQETKQWLAGLDEAERPERVVFVIITDGHENSSTEWRRDQVFRLVTECTEQGWTFIYLGANQDAISVGTQLGVSANTSMAYTGHTVRDTYSSLSASVARARAGAAAGFTEEERAASETR